MTMRFGLFLPPFHVYSDPRRTASLARSAEEAGWDGFFIWDHMLAGPGVPVADPWVTMAAVATETSRLRFGAMITPLARRRPWVMARQIATLDTLSSGRLVVGVGLGDDGWREFSSFGETTDPVARAAVLDESLELLQQLIAGDDVRHDGPHFAVHTAALLPVPQQHPVPLWGACRWPHRRPIARAARLQGCFPIFEAAGPPPPPSPAEVTAVRQALLEAGAADGFDLVVRGALSLEDPSGLPETLSALQDAGVTWLLNSFGPDDPPAPVIERIVAEGPPRPA